MSKYLIWHEDFILIFLSIILIVVGIYNILFSKRINVEKRLEVYSGDEDMIKEKVSLKESLLSGIGFIGKLVSPKNHMEKKQQNLNQAYIQMRVEEFIGISLVSAVLMFLLFYFLTKLWPVALLGLVIGFVGPDVLVNIRKNKRIKQLNEQLPDALSILSNGLRAGFSFTQAMTVAASELESPISDEFSKIVRDNAFGMVLDEALRNFSNRTDDEDVDMLVTALIIQRKVGGNLAEILDTIASTIRDRMRIRGEIETLTAQGRMSAMVISILPFGVALLIFVMNPEYIMQLFTSKTGIIMVVGALFMQLVGMYIIMNMAKIEI